MSEASAELAEPRRHMGDALETNPAPRGRIGRELFMAGGASLVARAVSAILALISLPLLVDALSSKKFAIYSVVLSIPTMAAFIDGGLGSGIRSAVAVRHAHGDNDGVRSSTAQGIWIVGEAAVLLSLAGLAAMLLAPWERLLNVDSSTANAVQWSALVTLGIYAISLPISAGSRVLESIGRTHLVALAVVLPSLFLLGTTVALRASGTQSLVTFTTAGALSATTGSVALIFVARRLVGGSIWPRRPQSHVRQEIWRTTWPMLIISIALSVSYATDPVVVASRAGLDAAAQYAVGLKLSQVVTLTVYATGPALWAHFVRRRATGDPSATSFPLRLVLTYVGLASAVAVPFVAIGPSVASWWTSGEISPPTSLFMAFGVWSVILAGQLPLAMRLNDPKGLRFQAATTSLMAIVNLPLSVLLASQVGVAGPVWSSGVCLLTLHAIPLAAYGRISRKSGKVAA